METGGGDKNCRHYPCHPGLEDCTFCYCPFYPCLDGSRGRFIASGKPDQTAWDCSPCGWIHKTMVVKDIYLFLNKNKSEFL